MDFIKVTRRIENRYIMFQGYLYCVSILMSFIVCGVYVTLRDGCSAEMQSSVDVGDYFGSVRDACMCNPWVAFAGK